MMLTAASAVSAAPRPEGRHAARPLARLHAAADRALEVEPMAGAERLPPPIGWLVAVAGFGLLGALLRDRRPVDQGGTFEAGPFQ